MEGVAQMLLTLLALLIIIIFLGALYAFFYAIFLFIFSAGEDDKIKKAWSSIRYMILGIIATLFVLFFFPIILQKANIPGYEFYTAKNIFLQVSKITGGIINLGQDAMMLYQQGGNQYKNANEIDEDTQNAYKDIEL